MKTIDVWSVLEWDGGELHKFSCYMSKETVTEAEIKEKLPHCHVRAETLMIFESFADREANNQLALRKKARDKLTSAERAAYGLVDPYATSRV